MKKRFTLLLSLLLIGSSGLAAGIEASKRAGEPHTLLQAQEAAPPTNKSPTPTTIAMGRIATSAFPVCLQENAATIPLVFFFFKGEGNQPSLVIGEATCMVATEGGKTTKKIPLFFHVYPQHEAASVETEEPTAPPTIPLYDIVPGDPETLRFIR
jgi:hypothetical protein